MGQKQIHNNIIIFLYIRLIVDAVALGRLQMVVPASSFLPDLEPADLQQKIIYLAEWRT